MNRVIIEQFVLLIKQNTAEYILAKTENDAKNIKNLEHKLKANKKILNIIKNLDFDIKNGSDVADIPGIGAKTISRINEIINTGHLDEIKNKFDQEKQAKINSIQELENIIGIGSSNARKLVTKYNITSVEQLRDAVKNNKINVGKTILLGLKYYEIVKGDIPRREITKISEYLSSAAHNIDPELHVIICGSYRRGRKTSGDIDAILYHPSVLTSDQIVNHFNYNLPSYLELFVDYLIEDHFLLDNMVDNKNTKYMGFCKYGKNPVRRIDIRYFPYNSLPAATLYFTGPYELNTKMRSAAKKRNLKLNEYGLYRINPKDGKDIAQINITSEKDIFEYLGMEYLTPTEREKLNEGKISKSKI